MEPIFIVLIKRLLMFEIDSPAFIGPYGKRLTIIGNYS